MKHEHGVSEKIHLTKIVVSSLFAWPVGRAFLLCCGKLFQRYVSFWITGGLKYQPSDKWHWWCLDQDQCTDATTKILIICQLSLNPLKQFEKCRFEVNMCKRRNKRRRQQKKTETVTCLHPKLLCVAWPKFAVWWWAFCHCDQTNPTSRTLSIMHAKTELTKSKKLYSSSFWQSWSRGKFWMIGEKYDSEWDETSKELTFLSEISCELQHGVEKVRVKREALWVASLRSEQCQQILGQLRHFYGRSLLTCP